MAKVQKRPAEAWRYVLIGDRSLPLDQQSRFLLKPMAHGERATFRDDLSIVAITQDGSRHSMNRTRQKAFELALSNIVSVENFPVGDAKPWPESRKERERYLDMLDDDDVLEIGNEIWARSSLAFTDDPAAPGEGNTVGNSSPPAPTSGSGGDSAPATATTV